MGMDRGGDKGKGKGKSQQTNLNATADRPSKPPPGFTGCWWCNSLDHYARDCPKGRRDPAVKPTHASVITLCGLRATGTNSPTSSDPSVLEGREEVAGIPTTVNPFRALEPTEQDDSCPPSLADSDVEEEMCCPPPPVNRWTRVDRTKPKRKRRHNGECRCCPPAATCDSASDGESQGAQEKDLISVLLPVAAESLNGIS